MTVADLIERLKAFPPDAQVIVTEDGQWADADPFILEPGERYDGLTFERPVLIF